MGHHLAVKEIKHKTGKSRINKLLGLDIRIIHAKDDDDHSFRDVDEIPSPQPKTDNSLRSVSKGCRLCTFFLASVNN